MKWATSDHHLFHNLMAELRGFKNIDSMNSEIFKKHNEVVAPTDEVYFIGDLTLKGPEYSRQVDRIIGKMNGRKHLILGNHDYWKPFSYIKHGFQTVHTSLEVDGFILNHDPAAAYIDRSRTWLCGHVHDLFKTQKNIINVSLEVWDLYPVNFDILNMLKKELL